MLALVARCGEQVLRFPIPRGRVCLGSGPSSDLTVPFRGVSRRHAFVEPHDGGLSVVDAGSRNGLSFRSRLVRECLLAPGDVVRLGEAWLGLEECDENDVEPGLSLEPDPGRIRPSRPPRPVAPARTTSSGSSWRRPSEPVAATRPARPRPSASRGRG